MYRLEQSLHEGSARGTMTEGSKVAGRLPTVRLLGSLVQVETAVRFLNNPKLQGASLNSRKEFLKKKGL